MTTNIDGKNIQTLSIDQLGAALQQIAAELSIRGNDPDFDESTSRKLLWAFDEVDEAARVLRKVFVNHVVSNKMSAKGTAK